MIIKTIIFFAVIYLLYRIAKKKIINIITSPFKPKINQTAELEKCNFCNSFIEPTIGIYKRNLLFCNKKCFNDYKSHNQHEV
jgi:hypothetical protein